MKKIISFHKSLFNRFLFISLLVLLNFISIVSAAAQTAPTVPCPTGTNLDQSSGLCLAESSFKGIAGSKDIGELISKILQLLLWVVGAISVLFIVIGGYQYITSHGNEEQAEKGKKTLVNSIIGLGLAILAYMIVRVITNALTKDIAP